MGLAAVTLDGRRTGAYERHRPETTTLYAVVRDNVETLYAAVAAGFDGAALPPFVDADVLCVSDELAERDPALAQLAAAAVSGLAPAGPELRRRPVELAFDGRPGVVISAPLSVREAGFSLHAATRAGAADEQGREALLKYILRPPLSTERLLPGPDGLVRIALKRPFSDGTVAVDLDPLSLLCRLVALVPAPRFHTVRYSGVLAAATKWRPFIVPKPEPAGPAAPASPSDLPPCGPPPECVASGLRYRPWAELLKRTLGIDVETCPRCRVASLTRIQIPQRPQGSSDCRRGLSSSEKKHRRATKAWAESRTWWHR